MNVNEMQSNISFSFMLALLLPTIVNTVDRCAPLQELIRKNNASVREDAVPGTTLITIPVSGNEVWTYRLGRTEDVDGTVRMGLEHYLKLAKISSNYELIVHTALDLEKIQAEFQSNELILSIDAVNEFKPQFIGLKNVTVFENTKVNTVILDLQRYVLDQDVNPSTNELSAFGISEYLPAPAQDGRPYFGMPNVQTGAVVLNKPLDYELLSMSFKTTFFLNVSASDVHGWTTYATVTIQIADVDDLPPEFYNAGCPQVQVKTRPCLVSYYAEVLINYKGQITSMLPGLIEASDMDSLDSPISYSLEPGTRQPLDILNRFMIDNVTGALFLTIPFQERTEVYLVIVATEVSAAAHSTRAPLTLYVRKKPLLNKQQNPLSTLEMRAPGHEQDILTHDKNSAFMYATGVLAVLFALVIAGMLVGFWLVKDKGKKNNVVVPVNPSHDPTLYRHSLHEEIPPFDSGNRPSDSPARGNSGKGSPYSSEYGTSRIKQRSILIDVASESLGEGAEAKNGIPGRHERAGSGEGTKALNERWTRKVGSAMETLSSPQEENSQTRNSKIPKWADDIDGNNLSPSAHVPSPNDIATATDHNFNKNAASFQCPAQTSLFSAMSMKSNRANTEAWIDKLRNEHEEVISSQNDNASTAETHSLISRTSGESAQQLRFVLSHETIGNSTETSEQKRNTQDPPLDHNAAHGNSSASVTDKQGRDKEYGQVDNTNLGTEKIPEKLPLSHMQPEVQQYSSTVVTDAESLLGSQHGGDVLSFMPLEKVSLQSDEESLGKQIYTVSNEKRLSHTQSTIMEEGENANFACGREDNESKSLTRVKFKRRRENLSGTSLIVDRFDRENITSRETHRTTYDTHTRPYTSIEKEKDGELYESRDDLEHRPASEAGGRKHKSRKKKKRRKNAGGDGESSPKPLLGDIGRTRRALSLERPENTDQQPENGATEVAWSVRQDREDIPVHPPRPGLKQLPQIGQTSQQYVFYKDSSRGDQ